MPQSCFLTPLVSIHLDSFRILLTNLKLFLFIFLLTSLPLASIIQVIAASTHSLQSQIRHLETLALYASTRFEARHVWQESRQDAISLIRFKAVFLLPFLCLSLVSAVAVCSSVVLGLAGKRPSLTAALTSVIVNWKRPLATSLVVYSIQLGFAAVLRVMEASGAGVVAAAVGAGVEVYVMAVMGLALVVSVNEDVVGWEAVVCAFGLMKGRRMVGWVLSGSILFMSSLVGWKMEGLMDEGEFFKEYSPGRSKIMIVMMSFGDELGLVLLLGLVVLWSYVVTAVFYCECRRNNVVSVSVVKSEDGICGDDV
uniref:Transmembrane protein n=1 Tax=Kalanchoe fedtschenkoi TaxID=63787 RepID=A0A7N0VH75_KALFE